MSRFYPPPQPFIGGSQPLAPRRLAPPLLVSDGYISAEDGDKILTEGGWRLITEDAAQDGPSNPSFAGGARNPRNLSAILITWIPPAPQPWQLPKRQTITGVSYVDEPPGYTTIYSWEPPDPYPQQRRFFTPGATAADVPPRYTREKQFAIRSAWEVGWSLPPRQNSQILSVDQPPRYSTAGIYAIRQQWETVPQPWQGWRYVVQPFTAVPDQPPRYSLVAIYEIRQQWEPGPAAPWQIPPRRILSVDQPPKYSLVDFYGTRQQWEPGPPAPWSIPPRQIVSVDQPPVPPSSDKSRYSVLYQWQPGPPQPWQIPSRRIVSVDQPPPWRGTQLQQIQQAWQPGPPPAQGWRYVTPVPPVVNDPPPHSTVAIMSIVDAWIDRGWIQHKYNRYIPGEIVSDPPWGLPSRRATAAAQAVQAWQDPPPLPFTGYIFPQRGIGVAWKLQGTIIRTPSGAQKCIFTLVTGDNVLPAMAQYTTAAENLATPLTLKLVISGSLAGDVAGELYKEVWFPAI